jgi:hypothetical protein
MQDSYPLIFDMTFKITNGFEMDHLDFDPMVMLKAMSHMGG